jgi:hypothetical protein
MVNNAEYDTNWKKSGTQVFWGEIAPCEHVVQIYEDDDAFLSLLTEFVSDGIQAGECVILIATDAHIVALEQRLKNNFDVFELKLRDQLIIRNAEETLNRFMVDNWPDANLFTHIISNLIAKGKNKYKSVRAFGEMVALLWAQGNSGATVQLEHLWNRFAQTESFILYCAYPKSGFTQDAQSSLQHICGQHAKVIASQRNAPKEIFYQAMSGQPQ